MVKTKKIGNTDNIYNSGSSNGKKGGPAVTVSNPGNHALGGCHGNNDISNRTGKGYIN